jgi:tol-pal system protein YbgF
MQKKLFFFIVTFLITFKMLVASYAQGIDGYNERIEQQELEIRRLTGDVETLKYKNQNLEVKINGLRKEMELRFKDLEDSKKNSNPETDTSSDKADIKDGDAVTKVLSPATETKSGTATVLYDAAQSDLQRKNYNAAATGFERIIKDYPQHNLTPNAYYWLGETYYARKEYDKAALSFLEGKRKFPNSAKAGHNLLKLGLSLHYLKQDNDACLTFDEVEKYYVAKDKSLEAILKDSRSKVGCKR